MQWSIRRAMDDAVFAWITLPVTILISAFLFAILSVNHFSETVAIFLPFGVMCIILTGAHVLRHRLNVLMPFVKEDIKTSMRIIRDKQRIINDLRRQLADPLIPPVQKANIEARIKELEEEIRNEVEASFKSNVEILYTLDGARVETALKELKESYEKSSD